MTKSDRKQLLVIIGYAEKIHQLLEYFAEIQNQEQREATFYELIDNSVKLAKAFIPFEKDISIGLIENNHITDKSVCDLFNDMINEDEEIKIEEVEEELDFLQTPESLLDYLNEPEDDEGEHWEGTTITLPTEDNDGDVEHQAIKEEIRRRLFGESPTQFGDDYHSLEKEKLIEDSVKAIQSINQKIHSWNLYRDSKGVWKRR